MAVVMMVVQGMTVVNVSATTFSKTMDWLHSYLLQVKKTNFNQFHVFFLLTHFKVCIIA
jgi:hypothetical protein